MAILLQAYLAITLLASALCFAAFGLDKRYAVRGQRRIRERTLHLLAFAGGWPGALAGQRVFRHKTQKLAFRAVLWLIVLLHVATLSLLVWYMWGEPTTARSITARVEFQQ